MHFCQDELVAVMALMPWAAAALVWLRSRFRRLGGLRPVRVDAGPYRSSCPCPEHEVPWTVKLKQAIGRAVGRVADSIGPIWPLW